MPGSKVRLLDPVSAAWNTVARFDDYETAQRAVDRLSDDGFPVEKLDIVGSDLRLVERVTAASRAAPSAGAGRLCRDTARAVHVGALFLAVAATGAAHLGSCLRVRAHASTKGQRDFSSVRQLVATRYDLIAREGTVDRASPCSARRAAAADRSGR